MGGLSFPSTSQELLGFIVTSFASQLYLPGAGVKPYFLPRANHEVC